MAKLQIISTTWPGIEIFFVWDFSYQRTLQWVHFIAKSFIHGYFDIIISSILPKAAKAQTEIPTIL